ncbi:hypothetical protein CRUP_020688 [Coryphaenoides rupestris]|nr:hypothetical protein CRUP_020688 [Coryphaenoides rupestris]
MDAAQRMAHSSIHEACNLGHLSVVEALLAGGALLNTPGYENDSPLHDTTRNGHLAIARLLLQHGASQSVLSVSPLWFLFMTIGLPGREALPPPGTHAADLFPTEPALFSPCSTLGLGVCLGLGLCPNFNLAKDRGVVRERRRAGSPRPPARLVRRGPGEVRGLLGVPPGGLGALFGVRLGVGGMPSHSGASAGSDRGLADGEVFDVQRLLVGFELVEDVGHSTWRHRHMQQDLRVSDERQRCGELPTGATAVAVGYGVPVVHQLQLLQQRGLADGEVFDVQRLLVGFELVEDVGHSTWRHRHMLSCMKAVMASTSQEASAMYIFSVKPLPNLHNPGKREEGVPLTSSRICGCPMSASAVESFRRVPQL